jgi:hypothetical protein
MHATEKKASLLWFIFYIVKKDEVIADFVGEFITHEEYNIREQVGLGGYAVYINDACVLDCQPFLNICKASFANSPYKCLSKVSRVEAVANAQLSYDHIRRKARLIASVEMECKRCLSAFEARTCSVAAPGVFKRKPDAPGAARHAGMPEGLEI